MRIVFAGTPHFAQVILNKILKDPSINIAGVLTQPDRRSGRGKKISSSPVKMLAQDYDLSIIQPVNLKDPDSIEAKQLRDWQPDLMIVAAYGLILPQYILDIPIYGCINAHASLLPRWRGAAPIQHALLSGDPKTGISIMQMEKGLDSGPVISMESIRVANDDTAGIIHDKLATLAAQMIYQTIHDFQDHKISSTTQDHTSANYAHKLDKQDAKIDWHNQVADIERAIRAYNPWPIAHTVINNTVIRIFSASILKQNPLVPCGTIVKISKTGIEVAATGGIINITRLQLPGKKPIQVQDFVNSLPNGFAQGAHCE
ncbi:MAG: methionyl-tRNA formyltransferase [Francisellaceae bacterium]|nr:methionyl-tRNA formyltransferase [Francisellaceae bacterium]